MIYVKEKNPRTKRIILLFTEKEHATLTERAQTEGLPPAAYLRRLALIHGMDGTERK